MCLRLPKLGGNPLYRSSNEESKKNAEIENIIRKDKRKQAKQVKILLLGRLIRHLFSTVPIAANNLI